MRQQVGWRFRDGENGKQTNIQQKMLPGMKNGSNNRVK